MSLKSAFTCRSSLLHFFAHERIILVHVIMYVITFRIFLMIGSFFKQLMTAVAQWDVSGLLQGKSWIRNQVGVHLFSFGKIGSFKEKYLRFFVSILKRDFVSSQSAFIQGINTSEILKINPIQN